MAMADVYCLFNRARGTELVSPDDLLQACTCFPQAGVPLAIKQFSTGALVVQSRSHSTEQVCVMSLCVCTCNLAAQGCTIQFGVPAALSLEWPKYLHGAAGAGQWEKKLWGKELLGKGCRKGCLHQTRLIYFLQQEILAQEKLGPLHLQLELIPIIFLLRILPHMCVSSWWTKNVEVGQRCWLQCMLYLHNRGIQGISLKRQAVQCSAALLPGQCMRDSLKQ